MERITSFFTLLSVLVLFSSCEKDEIPVEYVPELIEQGAFTSQLDMSSDYRFRLYYDIETDSVIAFHQKTDWDLSFACGPTEDRIRLNDSKLMLLWKVEGASLEDLTAVQGNGPLLDTSDGLICATDGWVDAEAVYVIDRGFDEAGVPQGRYKVEFISVDADSYVIRYAELASNTIFEAVIEKDPSRNEIQFSFDSGVQLLEPAKEDWDLLFTHYTFYFEEEEIPYLVAGVLLNPYLVQAQALDIYDFEAIDEIYLSDIQLTDRRDIIGYDWKYFDLDSETYSVVDNAFAIRTPEGSLFKLQFTSFVDAEGERGAPAFRAAQLQ
ncbi:MAG: hypothetical protein HKO93_00360 [Flavobacteriales bacterium]|nr:hypothetical protein [Flavobacteriales bacterium]